MNEVRILGVGAAAPGLRVPVAAIQAAWDRRGGRNSVGLCGGDEDSLTLAWDAATAAMSAGGLDPNEIDGLWWGTTTPPFGDGPSLAVLANALGVGPHGALCSGSPHAGIDALQAAADAVAAGRVAIALVVVSDALRAGPGTGFEGRAGAGGAALLLATAGGASKGPANVRGGASLGPSWTRSRPLLDRYRGAGELDQRDLYDGRLFREVIFLPLVGEVVDAARETSAVAAWSLPDPDGRLGNTVGRRATESRRDETDTASGTASNSSRVTSSDIYAQLGDSGAAAPLLGIIGALDQSGRVVAVGYGGGRATAIAIDVASPVPGATDVADALTRGRDVSYNKALRTRGQIVPGGETIPMGVPPESALFARGAEEMLQFLGARCDDCGTVNTPPSIHPHCIACGGPKLEPVHLARHGVVHTYVVNYTMPAPFEAPLPIAVIDLDDGARVMLQVDDDGEALAIGGHVDLILRKYAHERGVPVYGYKARPRAASAAVSRKESTS